MRHDARKGRTIGCCSVSRGNAARAIGRGKRFANVTENLEVSRRLAEFHP